MKVSSQGYSHTNSSLIDMLENLQSLGKARPDGPSLCISLGQIKVVQHMPEEQTKFALNAAVDVLPISI